MNIWPPEQVQTISPMNPLDNASGILYEFTGEPGPIAPPFWTVNGATQAFLRRFQTVFNIHRASPGYDGTEWLWDDDANSAPPTYPPDNPWVPADGPVIAFESLPTNYEWGGDFTDDLGGVSLPYPPERWTNVVLPMIPYWVRILPLYHSGDRYLTGPGRMRRQGWIKGDEEIIDGFKFFRWNQPDGAGVTAPIDEAFTVYSYYSLDLIEYQCPIFRSFSPIQPIVPFLIPPLLLLLTAFSEGGGIVSSTLRRRKDG